MAFDKDIPASTCEPEKLSSSELTGCAKSAAVPSVFRRNGIVSRIASEDGVSVTFSDFLDANHDPAPYRHRFLECFVHLQVRS